MAKSFGEGFIEGFFRGRDWKHGKEDRKRKQAIEDKLMARDDERFEWERTEQDRKGQRFAWEKRDQDIASEGIRVGNEAVDAALKAQREEQEALARGEAPAASPRSSGPSAAPVPLSVPEAALGPRDLPQDPGGYAVSRSGKDGGIIPADTPPSTVGAGAAPPPRADAAAPPSLAPPSGAMGAPSMPPATSGPAVASGPTTQADLQTFLATMSMDQKIEWGIANGINPSTLKPWNGGELAAAKDILVRMRERQPAGTSAPPPPSATPTPGMTPTRAANGAPPPRPERTPTEAVPPPPIVARDALGAPARPEGVGQRPEGSAAPRRVTYFGSSFDIYPDGRIVNAQSGVPLDPGDPQQRALGAQLVDQVADAPNQLPPPSGPRATMGAEGAPPRPVLAPPPAATGPEQGGAPVVSPDQAPRRVTYGGRQFDIRSDGTIAATDTGVPLDPRDPQQRALAEVIVATVADAPAQPTMGVPRRDTAPSLPAPEAAFTPSPAPDLPPATGARAPSPDRAPPSRPDRGTGTTGADARVPLTDEGTPAESAEALTAAATAGTSGRDLSVIGGDKPVKSTAAQRERAAKSFEQHYAEVGAPKVIEYYLRTGQIEKAAAFKEFIKDGQVKEGLRHLALAAHAQTIGDEDRVFDELAETYNAKGYVDDGYSLIREQSGYVRDENGDVAGASLAFRNDATGEVHVRNFNSMDGMIEAAFGALMPEKVFEDGMAAIQEEQKTAREARRKDAEFNSEAKRKERAYELAKEILKAGSIGASSEDLEWARGVIAEVTGKPVPPPEAASGVGAVNATGSLGFPF